MRSFGLPGLVALMTLSVVACDDGGAPNPPPPDVTADALEIVSGDNQRTATSRPLASPLRVRVIGSDDQPLPGATVQWSVTQGQASLDPTQSTTDASGETETRATLGTSIGSIAISGTVATVEPVSFSITALNPSAFISVSAGASHTCGVSAAGDAYCWGRNLFGELGDGTTTDQVSPVLVLGGLSFAAVSAGVNYTCGVTIEGVAYCWGENDVGNLGDGTRVARPVAVPVAGGLRFTAVSTSDPHTCGLTAEGIAYCWGYNGTGELGNGTASGPETCGGGVLCSTVPVPVAGSLSFADVDVGIFHTCGITTARIPYCWGSNFDGMLGTGTATGPETCRGNECSTVPVGLAGGLNFVALSAGRAHSCGVTDAGAAYCWGGNRLGRLGVGTKNGPETCLPTPTGGRICSTVPVPVAGGVPFADVDAGGGHTCGVTAAGAAYCWGLNETGQLGIGNTTGPESCLGVNEPVQPCSTSPVAVVGGFSFIAVSVGELHTCGVTAAGAAYCWGWNESGQIGDGTKAQRSTPVLVTIGG